MIILFLSHCGVEMGFGKQDVSLDDHNQQNIQSGNFYPGMEKFGELWYNIYKDTEKDNLSTFSIDVDEGAYTFGRNKINYGQVPPPASVRVEEYINYFDYDYPFNQDKPLTINATVFPSPFRDSTHILHIGLKGKESNSTIRKPWNLTFLIDVSGSMQERLPLVKSGLTTLINNMKPQDKISICTYAGQVSTLLKPTSLKEIHKDALKAIVNSLTAGGSTAMGSGIQNAYTINQQGFIIEGVNRVIVCSDGDANVGNTTHEEILKTIEHHVKEGIMLSTIGFGLGNFNDHLMEQLANKGNGNYYYIDNEDEVTRVFSEKLTNIIETIAKDVKIQVEFNKNRVKRYRLIGYENRAIADSLINSDTTDAGEIGSGHEVTALHEMILHDNSENFAVIKLRYKEPTSSVVQKIDIPITADMLRQFSTVAQPVKFSIVVSETAQILRKTPFVNTNLNSMISFITNNNLAQNDQQREFLTLIQRCPKVIN